MSLITARQAFTLCLVLARPICPGHHWVMALMRDGVQMTVTIICPNLRCRSVLQVPASVRGKKVRCERCGKNLIVPMRVSKKPPQAAPGQAGAPDKSTK